MIYSVLPRANPAQILGIVNERSEHEALLAAIEQYGRVFSRERGGFVPRTVVVVLGETQR